MEKNKWNRAVIIYICLAAVLVLGIVKWDALLAWISNFWSILMPLASSICERM